MGQEDHEEWVLQRCGYKVACSRVKEGDLGRVSGKLHLEDALVCALRKCSRQRRATRARTAQKQKSGQGPRLKPRASPD